MAAVNAAASADFHALARFAALVNRVDHLHQLHAFPDADQRLGFAEE